MKRVSCPREVRADWQESQKKAEKARVEVLKDYLLVHDSLKGFDNDKDYTKHYRQEDVFRGLEEAVKTVIWFVTHSTVCIAVSLC